MFESTYQEVSEVSPGLRLRRSIPPFVKRRLIHIYHGRFCFKMPGVHCGPDETHWSRQRGQKETLQLGASAYGIGIGYSREHTHTDTIGYMIGPGASVSPVWCHEDSELHVYENSSYLGGYRFRRQPKTFWPADPGFFHGNYVNPDPECRNKGPGGSYSPRGPVPSPLKIPGTEPAQSTQLIEPVSFTRTGSDGEHHDPDEVAAAAAQLLADDLVPIIEPDEVRDDDWYSPGLLGLGGQVTWLDESAQSPEQPRSLVLASAGRVARQRGFLSMSDEERSVPIPILAFCGDTDAERAELSVVGEGEGGSGEVWSGEAAVRDDGLELPGVSKTVVLTTLWGHADLSSLPAGVSGSVLGRVYDAANDVVAELRVPFWTEEKPEMVAAATAAAARM